MNKLEFIGRYKELFENDMDSFVEEVNDKVAQSKFLVIGGMRCIGQAVNLRF